MIDLATRIKHLRDVTGLTQQQLAEIAGVSKQAVSQWESGETKNIRNKALFSIQRKTKFSAEWISTGAGPKMLADLSDPNIIDLSGLPQSSRAVLQAAFHSFSKQTPEKAVNSFDDGKEK